jgi:lipoprotein-anchoring transpeptidase ErfK/SrfK
VNRVVPHGSAKDALGTHWLSLSATDATPEAPGFGLHGTWNESSLGRPSDTGRIRFRNADIEELYALLPTGTLVNVAE